MKATAPLHPRGRGARRPRPDGPHARALFADAGTRACARARHGGGAWAPARWQRPRPARWRPLRLATAAAPRLLRVCTSRQRSHLLAASRQPHSQPRHPALSGPGPAPAVAPRLRVPALASSGNRGSASLRGSARELKRPRPYSRSSRRCIPAVPGSSWLRSRMRPAARAPRWRAHPRLTDTGQMGPRSAHPWAHKWQLKLG